MVTRYNGFGWYNPYGQRPYFLQVDSPQQEIRETPTLYGIVPIRVPESKPDPSLIFVNGAECVGPIEPQKENKVSAEATTTTVASTTTTAATTISTTDSKVVDPSIENAKMNSLEKSSIRSIGITLCVLGALGNALADTNLIIIFALISSLSCLDPNTGTGTIYINALNRNDYPALHYAIHIIPIIPTIFVFIIGVICLVIKSGRGSLANGLYGLSIFTVAVMIPLFIAFSIIGVVQAASCMSGVPILKLVLPAIMTFFGIIYMGLLIYLVYVLNRKLKGKNFVAPPPALAPAPTPPPVVVVQEQTPQLPPVQPIPQPQPRPIPPVVFPPIPRAPRPYYPPNRPYQPYSPYGYRPQYQPPPPRALPPPLPPLRQPPQPVYGPVQYPRYGPAQRPVMRPNYY